MKKIIYKWFWAWDADKEERWLNEMAAKGLAMTGAVHCRYEFQDCEPGEYQYRLDFLEHWPTHPESEKYISFVEDTGAEQIASYLRWVYFRKKTADGSFELFSDNVSRIRCLNRLLLLLGVFGIVNTYNGIWNLCIGLFYGSSFNTVCGILVFSMSVLIWYGFLQIYRQKRKLQKERQIYE